MGQAREEAERWERAAASRQVRLGPGSAGVVLWPAEWEIVESSMEFAEQWRCDECGTDLPAYKIGPWNGGDSFWICSACSMIFERRDSPDKFRLSGMELDRMDADELEKRWGYELEVVDDRFFRVVKEVREPAPMTLRRLWLENAFIDRTLEFVERRASGGGTRKFVFLIKQTELVTLVSNPASVNPSRLSGYYIDFVSLGGILDVIEAWSDEEDWFNQLPAPRPFAVEAGAVSAESNSVEDRVEELLRAGRALPK